MNQYKISSPALHLFRSVSLLSVFWVSSTFWAEPQSGSAVQIQCCQMFKCCLFIGLIPLYFYQRKHPVNLILLGVWVSLSPSWKIVHLVLPLHQAVYSITIHLTHMCHLQTALLSVSVGTTCTFYQPLVVLEALALTAAIVVALTVYTFNAARKGANFR